MNQILDAAVQLLQVGLMLGLIALVFDIRQRLKAIEQKLEQKT